MSTQAPTDFVQALDLYKTNYVQYRATGNAAYKLAYETAEKWIMRYLEMMNETISNDTVRINTFLNEYSNANPELADLQAKFQRIRTEGPAVQDKYATVRRVQTEVPAVDMTPYYVKTGLIAALVGLIALFSR